MQVPRITVSIVSHRQNALVNELLGDLARHCAEDIPIVLTENVPDAVLFSPGPLADRTQIIRNLSLEVSWRTTAAARRGSASASKMCGSG